MRCSSYREAWSIAWPLCDNRATSHRWINLRFLSSYLGGLHCYAGRKLKTVKTYISESLCLFGLFHKVLILALVLGIQVRVLSVLFTDLEVIVLVLRVLINNTGRSYTTVNGYIFKLLWEARCWSRWFDFVCPDFTTVVESAATFLTALRSSCLVHTLNCSISGVVIVGLSCAVPAAQTQLLIAPSVN